jgi:predicted CXXCH cytochrome family protein
MTSMACRSLQRGLVLAVSVVILGGCVDERIVFRDRDLLQGVPTEASGGFLGYSNVEASLTVCGNCHVGQQSQWVETAHAHTYARMQAVGSQQQVCRDCHATTSRGNVVETPNVGFIATGDARYHDVQCESCHGPGLQHVLNPSVRAAQPRAPIAIGQDLSQGCAQCHSGAHHPFVAEWAASRHARVIASAAANPACQGCHAAEFALDMLGVRADYLERGGEARTMPIVCAVCHDPHRADFEGQLRLSISIPSEEQNLCMRCHQKRGQPDPTTFRGPHSPEGPLLLGDAGWWPPNMPFEPGTRIAGTHGTERNPRLCAGCHVQQYTIPDQLTGEIAFVTAGHTFQATPCLDPTTGFPIPGRANCTQEQRSWRSCTGAGCHGSEAVARSITAVARLRIFTLADELDRLLAQVPEFEFLPPPTNPVYTTAKGARFNSQLARFPGSVVHNPFLLEALLIASIQQVRRDYNVQIAPGLSLESELNHGD